jgi:hypothetical protein
MNDEPRSDLAELRLRDAIEALPEAIAIFDQEDRFVLWNRQFERVYAGDGVEITSGLRFEEHLRNCLARGRVTDAVGREELWLAERLARFAAADGAYEHQLSSGRWVRVQDRSLAHGGRIGIRSDVTELVERKHSLRLLFDANPMPMLLIDRQTLGFLAVNDAAVATRAINFWPWTCPPSGLRPGRVRSRP